MVEVINISCRTHASSEAVERTGCTVNFPGPGHSAAPLNPSTRLRLQNPMIPFLNSFELADYVCDDSIATKSIKIT